MIVEIVPIRYLWSHFRRHAPLCAVLLALTVSGCGDWLPHVDLAPTYEPPQYVVPASWHGESPFVEANPSDGELRPDWWTLFNDPVLNRLEAQAMAVNPDLQAAAERFVQARDVMMQVFPLQIGYKKHGQSGIEVSDWLPHVASCVDDLAIVRSMYTTDNDHGAEAQIHTGRHRLDDTQPSIGAWVHYGLGSLNENLPTFLFLGEFANPIVTLDYQAEYLGPKHAGIRLSLDPRNPLPFAARGEE